MNVQVRLLGNLGQGGGKNHHPDKGLTVELSEDADVRQLIGLLPVSKPKGVIVSVTGRLVKWDHKLKDEDVVYVFQSVFGG